MEETTGCGEKSDEEILGEAKRLVSEWQWKLGLTGWHIRVVISGEAGEGGTLAEVDWDHYYRKAQLTVYGAEYREQTIKAPKEAVIYLEHCVIHELMHLLLAPIKEALSVELFVQGPLYQAMKRAIEGVCDQLATSIQRGFGRRSRGAGG